MDWTLAIIRNRDALLRIVAGLLAALGGVAVTRSLRRELLSILRPAESAARRLIVIAARELDDVAPPETAVPLPDFSAFKCASNGRAPSFRLIDPHKRFVITPALPAPKGEPRISVFDGAPRTPVQLSGHADDGREAEDTVDGTALTRRMAALEYALNHLPQQAKRLKRIMARRQTLPSGPRSTGPIRPGWPPGHRRKPVHDVDDILRDCHELALDVLGPVP